MKNNLLLSLLVLLLVSCNSKSTLNSVFVKDLKELNKAIKEVKPGTEIVLANGIWKDAEINFYGVGTQTKPIILRAENSGKVFIEGKSFLHLGGQYLKVDGLYFRNGYSPKNSIISYQINEDSTAFYSKITNCVIDGFTKPSRLTNDHWINFYGKHNTLAHCYITGKSNDGETLRVFQTGNKHNSNHHQIVNNYFGPRPRKGGPRAETIRIGDSKTHMTPGYVNVSNNYFEACNGEVEIISDKTNFNTFTDNIFYKCEGSFVLRHGSFAKVNGNIFIGDDDSDFYGGIRVINTGHWITNNYFYKINGSEFRSPLAVMNGIPKSQLNRYRQVTDVVIAHNTWVDCKMPWQIGVGQNKKSAGVLPEVEIRSAPPIRSIIANNLIYNHETEKTLVVNHDNIDGILFKNNVLDNNKVPFTEFNALQHQSLKIKKINDWLYAPENGQTGFINETYNGFEFDKIDKDLFNSDRINQNYVGAISNLIKAEKFKIDKKNYGPSWFSTEKIEVEPTVFKVSAKENELANTLKKANSGDIIDLIDENYHLKSSLKIDKKITLISSSKNKAKLIFKGDKNSPLFEMNPKGTLILKNISITGNKEHLAFAPLVENMSSAYNILAENCNVEGFKTVLKASKGSFSDTIKMVNTTIKNCENGFILAAEEKGDYNAEMVTFKGCNFEKINKNVIHFYRGGYDESTIGGILTLTNNTFKSCGKKEKSGVLIKSRGIVNVFLNENTFSNNPVKLVALLWGVKNNHHKNNTVINSGKIKVEEQQKLDLLY
ncbi:alginate lyase [Polaribacter vadi]|uniref:chondroitinase-B domain-containing protein n=1 Tax=Polaribacter TaxID=52959 RepID=UPI001C091794|nr:MULTISPECIES: chondroitinase-B domain-containing protein [Polaribacter]MBU3009788.1 alginate lyase [Polaribacter vadi]MDO6739593.1 chondroitinase-B domain-containing protein [Polaribacter sp. 1_MG-2023]